ncbi:hypothetical protein [Uliginosibacterium sediminicola]|uniref:Uncharacterized protein n=1 Tax=Uliginosibacterium sediminicola TaxID=2024550 RepID=A0ABU9YW18_9RHOO
MSKSFTFDADGDPGNATAQMLSLFSGATYPLLLRLTNYMPRVFALPSAGVVLKEVANEAARTAVIKLDGYEALQRLASDIEAIIDVLDVSPAITITDDVSVPPTSEPEVIYTVKYSTQKGLFAGTVSLLSMIETALSDVINGLRDYFRERYVAYQEGVFSVGNLPVPVTTFLAGKFYANGQVVYSPSDSTGAPAAGGSDPSVFIALSSELERLTVNPQASSAQMPLLLDAADGGFCQFASSDVSVSIADPYDQTPGDNWVYGVSEFSVTADGWYSLAVVFSARVKRSRVRTLADGSLKPLQFKCVATLWGSIDSLSLSGGGRALSSGDQLLPVAGYTELEFELGPVFLKAGTSYPLTLDFQADLPARDLVDQSVYDSFSMQMLFGNGGAVVTKLASVSNVSPAPVSPALLVDKSTRVLNPFYNLTGAFVGQLSFRANDNSIAATPADQEIRYDSFWMNARGPDGAPVTGGVVVADTRDYNGSGTPDSVDARYASLAFVSDDLVQGNYYSFTLGGLASGIDIDQASGDDSLGGGGVFYDGLRGRVDDVHEFDPGITSWHLPYVSRSAIGDGVLYFTTEFRSHVCSVDMQTFELVEHDFYAAMSGFPSYFDPAPWSEGLGDMKYMDGALYMAVKPQVGNALDVIKVDVTTWVPTLLHTAQTHPDSGRNLAQIHVHDDGSVLLLVPVPSGSSAAAQALRIVAGGVVQDVTSQFSAALSALSSNVSFSLTGSGDLFYCVYALGEEMRVDAVEYAGGVYSITNLTTAPLNSNAALENDFGDATTGDFSGWILVGDVLTSAGRASTDAQGLVAHQIKVGRDVVWPTDHPPVYPLVYDRWTSARDAPNLFYGLQRGSAATDGTSVFKMSSLAPEHTTMVLRKVS